MTKEELKEYIEVKREIEIIGEKIEFLESKKTSIKSQIITDMPRGEAEQDRLGQLLIQIEELIDLYNEKQDKLLKQQLKIEKCIDKLDSSLERNIMRYVYFEGMRFEEVSCIIHYSYRTVRRIHKRAIENLGIK
ncbi:sigma factor-like helix-turn-helix DNA-binding protein [Terrisporobacter sp.]|uniref:sigma factor-like helix-turn-helix DNA-binding protein n=1 Tax=Terrisporobacter sp. TaxID=1965305 RepID=UPI002637F831|nr:sigma factor-like helix-turn-helix DNA-binding protein [Terrisporobacter sp.]